MSEQTPTNLSNADFTFKDKYGNTGKTKGVSANDSTKLNNMVKLMNLMLNTPNSTDFINTLATKQYVDENQSSGHALFDVVPKDHVLTYGKDLEGFAPLGTWVYKTAIDGTRYGYPDFVQKCLDEYDEATADTITFDNVTLDIKRHSNGHIFFDVADIDKVNALFAERKEAWLYGIDETNERVFLPRSTRIKFGSTSEVGEYQEAGLPDHSHDVDLGFSASGGGGSSNRMVFSSSFAHATGLASQSNSIYGNSDTVEYSSTKMIPYMVVGNVKVEQASTDVIDVTTTNNDTVPLFAPHYFDYTPNNLSWLKGGAQSNSGDLYKTCYNELVNVLNGETKYGALKVIDEADMVSGTDYSLYWIVNQTTETFKTPTATQQRFVVKTYQNGTDWYRIYNDGWCEQGGYKNNTSDQTYTVNLLKSYLNTEYVIQFTPNTNNPTTVVTGMGQGRFVPFTKTKSSFNWTGGDVFSQASWYACGYIDLTNEQIDTSLYFKVANAVENIELLDVGAVTQVLSEKVGVADTEWATNACMPDYSAGVSLAQSVTSEQTFTMTDHGYLAYIVYGLSSTGYLKVNDNTIVNGDAYTTGVVPTFSGMITVGNGDIVKYKTNSTGGTYCRLVFYPCKGA